MELNVMEASDKPKNDKTTKEAGQSKTGRDTELAKSKRDSVKNENTISWDDDVTDMSNGTVNVNTTRETPSTADSKTNILNLDNSSHNFGNEPKSNDTCFARCRKGVCSDSSKVIITRLLFTAHVLLTIWRVTEVLGDRFWFMAGWLFLFIIDILVVIFRRKGKEWTWFQPIVLLYLVVEMSGIWFLELEKVSGVQASYNQSVILGDLYGKGGKTTQIRVSSLSVKINSNAWALLLEQSMLVLLIAARWLMPLGDMSKEQLSGLLLSYLGTASDVVDFFSVLSEDPELSLDLKFVFTILSAWSWSMIQFMFVVTMTKSDDKNKDNKVFPDVQNNSMPALSVDGETRVLMPGEPGRKNNGCGKGTSCCHTFVESEMWGIFVSMFLQDGPYVIVRLTCVFYWNIRTYTNYFFTAKNCMMLMLQVYRIITVYQKFHKKQLNKQERSKTL